MRDKRILYEPKHLKKLSIMIEKKMQKQEKVVEIEKKGLFQSLKKVFK